MRKTKDSVFEKLKLYSYSYIQPGRKNPDNKRRDDQKTRNGNERIEREKKKRKFYLTEWNTRNNSRTKEKLTKTNMDSRGCRKKKKKGKYNHIEGPKYKAKKSLKSGLHGY